MYVQAGLAVKQAFKFLANTTYWSSELFPRDIPHAGRPDI